MTKRPAEHPLIDDASTNGLDTHKRPRLDSATSASPKKLQPEVKPGQTAKTQKFLDEQSREDADIFPITYYRVSTKSASSRRSLAAKWKPDVLRLSDREYGKVVYAVGNAKHWDSMPVYKRCTVKDSTFELGECVRVYSNQDTDSDGRDVDRESTLTQWKAQIQEIRACDENNVFIRVSWLYRPAHDIPGGPGPYHGTYELVPSTELSIIDAKSIDGRLTVKYWDEWRDDEVHEEEQYFWRQSFNHLDKTLSECRSMCQCSEPQNPDWPIVQCSHCKEWMHAKCLEAEAVQQYLDTAQGPSNGTISDVTAKMDKNTESGHTHELVSTAGVKAAMHNLNTGAEAGFGGQGKLSITITDTREPQTKTEERGFACLLCDKPIDS